MITLIKLMEIAALSIIKLMKVFLLNRLSKFCSLVTDKALLTPKEMTLLTFWIKYMTTQNRNASPKQGSRHRK